MVFNLYILIISDLLVSRTPLITVLSIEGLSWVNIPFIIIIIIIIINIVTQGFFSLLRVERAFEALTWNC